MPKAPNFSIISTKLALQTQVLFEHNDVAKLLLEQEADPNRGTRSDEYPIMLASQNGDAELINLLIEIGADVNKEFYGDDNAMIQVAKPLNIGRRKIDMSFYF